jgi:hypothetical protein
MLRIVHSVRSLTSAFSLSVKILLQIRPTCNLILAIPGHTPIAMIHVRAEAGYRSLQRRSTGPAKSEPEARTGALPMPWLSDCGETGRGTLAYAASSQFFRSRSMLVIDYTKIIYTSYCRFAL